MKVERTVSSGHMERQFRIRSSVRSTAPGRFISFSTRGLACWNGMSRYGNTLPCAISGMISSTCGYG